VWTDASQLDYIDFGGTDLRRDYTWDDRGLLESDVLTDDGLTVASNHYTYDLDGNVKIEEVYLPGNPQAGMHTYGYDDAGRLTSWQLSATTIEYEWDGAGNRITAGSDSFEYDDRNRLTNGPGGDYTYTARGTLETVTDGGSTVTYGFDPLGRMVDYNSEAVFSYDGLDRVATRNQVPFSYIGAMLDPAGDGTFTYSRTPAGWLVSQTNDTTGEVSLVGLDRHGDLTWLADPVTGQVTDTAMYDPYGNPTASTGGITPTVGFQGDYTDPASGEVWMGARWYSGSDAVFRSRDTVFGELNTPVSLNRYTYAFANPLSYWDPDGRWANVMDGAGGYIEGFEDDGTPIRTPISETRQKRHDEVISAMETRAKIRELTGEANFETNQ
jgi:RHS repeat-associated protein